MGLEKFFDTVNQYRLITILGKRIKDRDVVSLIRKYLIVGVMEKRNSKSNRNRNITRREFKSITKQYNVK